jgi:hypothetical protein
VDEVAEHLLGGVEVGDDPVLERADGRDVAGVRPIIALASVPTARMALFLVLMATTDGSLRATPRPRT